MEFEWTVGPIPFRDGRGREVSLRFQSNLGSGALHHPQAMYTPSIHITWACTLFFCCAFPRSCM